MRLVSGAYYVVGDVNGHTTVAQYYEDETRKGWLYCGSEELWPLEASAHKVHRRIRL